MPRYKEGKTRHPALLCMALIATIAAAPVHAEYFGLANGRTAFNTNANPLSIELGIVTGKFADADYDNPTLRLNYRLSDSIQLYGDLSKSSVGSLDETAFGVGAFYDMGNLFKFTESAYLKGSLHIAKLSKYISGGYSTSCSGPVINGNPFGDELVTIDQGWCYTTLDQGADSSDTVQAFSMEVLLAGKPIEALRFNDQLPSWYLNLGVNSFQGSSLGSEIGVGGGLVLPAGQGEAYAGVDIIDEFLFGLGYRYTIK